MTVYGKLIWVARVHTNFSICVNNNCKNWFAMIHDYGWLLCTAAKFMLVSYCWFMIFKFILCCLICRYGYAPYRFLKRYGIKGPPPTPFLGHYKDRVTKVWKLLLWLCSMYTMCFFHWLQSALEYDQFLCDKYGPVCGYVWMIHAIPTLQLLTIYDMISSYIWRRS